MVFEVVVSSVWYLVYFPSWWWLFPFLHSRSKFVPLFISAFSLYSSRSYFPLPFITYFILWFWKLVFGVRSSLFIPGMNELPSVRVSVKAWRKRPMRNELKSLRRSFGRSINFKLSENMTRSGLKWVFSLFPSILFPLLSFPLIYFLLSFHPFKLASPSFVN